MKSYRSLWGIALGLAVGMFATAVIASPIEQPGSLAHYASAPSKGSGVEQAKQVPVQLTCYQCEKQFMADLGTVNLKPGQFSVAPSFGATPAKDVTIMLKLAGSAMRNQYAILRYGGGTVT